MTVKPTEPDDENWIPPSTALEAYVETGAGNPYESRISGRHSRNQRADGAEARGAALIAKHGVSFSRCRSIQKNLDELKKWISGSRARSLRLEIDRLCDAVEAAAAKRSAGKQSIEEKKRQLAAEIANRRAP